MGNSGDPLGLPSQTQTIQVSPDFDAPEARLAIGFENAHCAMFVLGHHRAQRYPRLIGNPMTFLLIHGASHGAWCWDPVIAAIEHRGACAVAIDLPGHGENEACGWAVGTHHYVRAITRAAEAIDGLVHLVGHSMGGAVISAAAEARPNLYRSLTYVAAFLLQNGESIPKRAKKFQANGVQKAGKFNPWRGEIEIDRNRAPDLFYHMCTPAQIAQATRKLGPQPLRPLLNKVRLSTDGWFTLPRNYIFCEQDQAIPYIDQKAMEASLPCQSTVSLNTDHSPFMSKPRELADALLSFTNQEKT